MERSTFASWVKISEGFDPWPVHCKVSSSPAQTQCLVSSETLEWAQPDKSLLVKVKRSERKYVLWATFKSPSCALSLSSWRRECDVFNQQLPDAGAVFFLPASGDKTLEVTRSWQRVSNSWFTAAIKSTGIFDFIWFSLLFCLLSANLLFSSWHQSLLKYLNLTSSSIYIMISFQI